jgi:hypothetical protein
VKFLYLDRFEGRFAVCEDDKREVILLEKKSLPQKAKEGCILRFENDGTVVFDEKETKARLKLVQSLEKKLFDK